MQLPELPEPFASLAAALVLLRWGVIPAGHATLDLLRDIRRYRAGR